MSCGQDEARARRISADGLWAYIFGAIPAKGKGAGLVALDGAHLIGSVPPSIPMRC